MIDFLCSFVLQQAQARCHRIGQSKAVKVYRLITRNSYEREMFDKASLKLGLDKAVLQSMGGEKPASAVSTYQPESRTFVKTLILAKCSYIIMHAFSVTKG